MAIREKLRRRIMRHTCVASVSLSAISEELKHPESEVEYFFTRSVYRRLMTAREAIDMAIAILKDDLREKD
jgi:hypothetical protein